MPEKSKTVLPRKLEWYVFMERNLSFHEYNIFDHGTFAGYCKDAYRKHREDKAAFLEDVRHALMYCFWSKCEYEILLRAWPPCDRDNVRKVDIYEQVMMNWHVFSEYVWENRKVFGRKR